MTGNRPYFLFEHEQRSAGWHHDRYGIPTSSYFHKIVTPVKAERTSERTWKDYRNQLIAEKVVLPRSL